MRRLAILASIACASSAAAQSVTPATYRVWLCPATCTAADSVRAVAEAVVVIIDDSTAATASARAFLATLPDHLLRMPSSVADNACFRVIRYQRSIGGEELFWGIIPSAATRISRTSSGGFALQVYSSPDAYYNLTWTEPGMLVSGEGWTSGPFQNNPSHRNAYFAALRIGAADLSRCRGIP